MIVMLNWFQHLILTKKTLEPQTRNKKSRTISPGFFYLLKIKIT